MPMMSRNTAVTAICSRSSLVRSDSPFEPAALRLDARSRDPATARWVRTWPAIVPAVRPVVRPVNWAPLMCRPVHPAGSHLARAARSAWPDGHDVRRPERVELAPQIAYVGLDDL